MVWPARCSKGRRPELGEARAGPGVEGLMKAKIALQLAAKVFLEVQTVD